MVGTGGGGGGVSEPALNISVFYCFPSTSLREPFYCKSERRNRRVSARPFVAFWGEPPPPPPRSLDDEEEAVGRVTRVSDFGPVGIFSFPLLPVGKLQPCHAGSSPRALIEIYCRPNALVRYHPTETCGVHKLYRRAFKVSSELLCLNVVASERADSVFRRVVLGWFSVKSVW